MSKNIPIELTAPLIKFDTLEKNGRVYSKECLMKACKDFNANLHEYNVLKKYIDMLSSFKNTVLKS